MEIAISSIQSKPERGYKLVYLAAIFASLAAIIGIIYHLRDDFPIWVQYGILIILFLYLLIMFYVFLYGIISLKFSEIRLRWKRNRVSRKYFTKMKILIEKFSELIKRDRGIINAFETLRSQEEGFRYLRIPQTIDIENMVFNLCQAMERFDWTADHFKLLNSQFENAMKIYAELYVNEILNDIDEVIRKDTTLVVPQKVKEIYDSQNDEYYKFLEKYVEFGEDFNRDYGGKVVRTNFDKFRKIGHS